MLQISLVSCKLKFCIANVTPLYALDRQKAVAQSAYEGTLGP